MLGEIEGAADTHFSVSSSHGTGRSSAIEAAKEFYSADKFSAISNG